VRINRRATAEQAHDTVGGHFHRYEVYLYPMTLRRTAGRLYGGPWSGTTPTDGTQLDDDPESGVGKRRTSLPNLPWFTGR